MTTTINAIYLFAGQGVTQQGMAREFLNASPDNKDIRKIIMDLVEQANIVGKESLPGFTSVTDIFEMSTEEQKKPSHTHMAMYPISVAAADIFEHIAAQNDTEINIVSTAGQSLGMYAAFAKAKQIPRYFGLELVAKRGGTQDDWHTLHSANTGQLIVNPSDYTMAAIIVIDTEHVRQAANDTDVDVTNENSPIITNIAGPRILVAQAINLAATYARKKPTTKYLDIAPFHSRWMGGAAQAYAKIVADKGLESHVTPSGIKVFSDLNGLETTAEEFTQYAGSHLSTKVNFRAVADNVIDFAEEQGAAIIALAGNQAATSALASCFRKRTFNNGQLVTIHQVYSPETARDVVTQLTT